MKITDLLPNDSTAIHQAAQLLVDGFKKHYPSSWPDLASGLKEVEEALEEGRIRRIAMEDDGTVVGWIGGIPQYDGHVWELHPLVVRPDRQGQRIGTALVRDFEEQVRLRGGLTIWLGADDEDDQTSLSGVDLYPNVWEHIARIENRNRHQYEFYQKMGFVIAGVVPDANGPGKPDILMAKRVAPI